MKKITKKPTQQNTLTHKENHKQTVFVVSCNIVYLKILRTRYDSSRMRKESNKQTNTLLSTNLYFSSYVCIKWMKRENDKKKLLCLKK